MKPIIPIVVLGLVLLTAVIGYLHSRTEERMAQQHLGEKFSTVHVGDQTVKTNGDGTITISVVTKVGIRRTVSLSPAGWMEVIAIDAGVLVSFIFIRRKKSN